MTEKDDEDIPDDKLLALPENNSGGLSRLWAARSNLLHQRELGELNAELSGNALTRMLFPWTDPRQKKRIEDKRRQDQIEYEQAMREITERRDQLLLRIEEEQARIETRRQEIEDNALRLRDGCRVYVDGDRYRDGQGVLLTGADEAEAARQHEVRPDASTSKDKQDIDRKAADMKRLKNKIFADKESGQPPEETGQRLDGYEKEFAKKVDARSAQRVSDYMADYALSSIPAFTAAAANVKPATGQKPKEEDSGTASVEMKKTPQTPAQGALKL